jgi:hypothetical protein
MHPPSNDFYATIGKGPDIPKAGGRCKLRIETLHCPRGKDVAWCVWSSGKRRKKMRIAPLLGVAVLGLWPGLAQAIDLSTFTLKTTEDLYQVCTVPPDDPLRREAIDFCEGFLVGAVSYHDAVSDRKHLKRLICYPQTVTRDEGIQAFVDWAAAHQQDHKFMSDPAVIGLVRGLAAKWPCK